MSYREVFAEYLEGIDNPQHRGRLEEVFDWIVQKFPNLVPRVAWNQPMFTDHGTYIIGFSISKQHMAVSPEKVTLQRFEDDLKQAGYSYSKMIFRIRWNEPVDYTLLENMIAFNIADKADYTTFWRKES